MCSSICNSYCFLLFSIFCSKGSGKEMQLGCKVKISGMSGKDFASRHFPYRQYRRCSSRRFPVADRGNSRVKRYLSLFLHPISEVLDLWQHPEKWKNTELFLYISVSFFPVWRLLCILRYTIQGVGYTNLAMLSGVLEMIARILVSLLAVPAFGCLAVCFGDLLHGFLQMPF